MWDGALAGMRAVQQENDRSNLSQISALSHLQGMQKAAIDAEANAGQRQREAQFRTKLSELGANPTHEQVRALALQSGVLAPKDVLSNDLGMYRADATKEIAVSRLAAQKLEHDRNYELAKTKVTNQAQQQALDAWYKQGKMELAVAAAKYGIPADIFNGASIGPAPTSAPTAAAPISSLGKPASISPSITPAEVMRISDPQERAAAMEALQAGRFSPDSPGAAPSPVPASPTAPISALSAPTPVPAVAPPAQPAIPAPEMGANEDMRDVQARQARLSALQAGQPAAPTAPVAPPAAVNQPVPLSAMNGAPQAPAEKKQVTIADAPAGLSRKDKDKWVLQQTKPSISGNGELSPAALAFTAKQYLTGDRQAAAGFARSTTARVALQNAIVDEAVKQGKGPEEVAALMQEYAGGTAASRTVGQRAANIALAASEAQDMLSVVKEQSDKFKRTNFVPWNMALKAYESGTGSPEIAAFGASVNALVNVYARAINPTGVPTKSDKEHAREVINTVQSPEQTDAVLGIIKRELEIAKKAPSSVKAQIRENVAPSKNNDFSHLWGGK